MRATKMRNKGKDRTITSRAREPDEVCGGEMKSSLSVVKVDILCLRLSRGLDARGCRLLWRRSVMPWWRRGSYATTMSTVDHPRTPNILDCLTNLSEYLCGGMTRPRIFTFSFVSSVSGRYMLSELNFEDFCVVFSWVKSLG